MPLVNLRVDYLVNDIPDLDQQLLEANLVKTGTEELRYRTTPREYTRKPKNAAQKTRKQQNRKANKRVAREILQTTKPKSAPPPGLLAASALRTTTPKSGGAPPLFGTTSKAPGAPPPRREGAFPAGARPDHTSKATLF